MKAQSSLPVFMFVTAVGFAACSKDKVESSGLTITGISPAQIDPLGGTRIVVRGSGFEGITSLTIGGVAATRLVVISDSEVNATTGEVEAGTDLSLVLTRGSAVVSLDHAVEAWSPAQIVGARVFDAASGIAGRDTDAQNQPARSYEWVRLTDNIHPDWRARDGAALSWLPATGKLWMTGGWNGAGPDAAMPGFGLETLTSNEVWSSPDGVNWTLELPDGNDQFIRRHIHNAIVWRDRIWLIGGDGWQDFYNNDLVSSADGVHWRVEANPSPWSYEPDGSLLPTSGRALQGAGVFQDKLWVVGGQGGILKSGGDQGLFHNDVWNTDDGVNWTRVAATSPWEARGSISQLLEFKGRMWLIGGARYAGGVSSFYRETWSTTNGIDWTQHATPPWSGKIFTSLVVFDNRMWVINGANVGNTAETWYTDDGETWIPLPLEAAGVDTHPPSHADGVTVAEGLNMIVFGGGNYSFLGWSSLAVEKSVWGLRAFRGTLVERWSDRASGLTLSAGAERRPIRDPNGLGDGIPGVQFDGHFNQLDLANEDVQAEGRSVFWVGRTPSVGRAYVDYENSPQHYRDFYVSPDETVLGGGADQSSAVGITNGSLHFTQRMSDGATQGDRSDDVWSSVTAGSGLQRGKGDVHFVGFTHGSDGLLQAWLDGAPSGAPTQSAYVSQSWATVGSGVGYAYPGAQGVDSTPNHFSGTLGAVVVLPSAVDAATIEKIHIWAQGRFGTP